MSLALDENTHLEVQRLCALGDDLSEKKNYALAIERYQEALKLLPQPARNWEAATWIFAAIGDAQYLSGNFQAARDSFTEAVNSPKGLGNPFIHLRLGEIQIELGNEIVAADELARAYMGGGKKVFEKEPKKYFDLVKRTLREPPEGW